MADDIVDEVTPYTPAARAPRASSSARPLIEEEFHESGLAIAAKPAAEPEGDDEPTEPAKPDSVRDDPDGEGEPDDPDDKGLLDEPEGATAPEAPKEGEPAEEEEEPAEPEEIVALREGHARLEQANRRLLADLEAERKKPRTELSDRERALLEAEQLYVDKDPITAVRRLIATVLDVEPDSKDVDAELSALYMDLTSRELGVPLDQSQKDRRDMARARLELLRDKRERTKSSEPAKPQSTDEIPDQAVALIDSRLTEKRDGKSVADEFPLLTAWAEEVSGMKPAKLIATVLKREYQTGTIDPSLDENAAIRAVAQQIEKKYKALADKIPQTQPPSQPDTTSGGNKPAAAKTASTEQRKQRPGRTPNNKAASVAPATSPKQPKEPAPEQNARPKDPKKQKEWALRHLPS